ncbi:aldolase [Pseudonocardia sp. CNS-139]|nr:aldolase [Pseudonocardia sp. CNS-139]
MDDERTHVAATCRRLAADGLVIGTAGNVSVRVGDRVVVTATGARFETITPEHVTVVDLDGRVTDGGPAPTSEIGLHLGVLRRFGSSAVVHTHAPVATAVGLVVDELPCVHYQMLALGGPVRVAPYRLFGTPELADAVLTALEGRAAALMANHGAVTHAGDLDTAVENALLLEWACELYRLAASMGTPRTLDAAAQQEFVAAVAARGYGRMRPADEEGR